MTPFEASRASLEQTLGLISCSAETLSAIAQFGIYYELHKMNKLMEAPITDAIAREAVARTRIIGRDFDMLD